VLISEKTPLGNALLPSIENMYATSLNIFLGTCCHLHYTRPISTIVNYYFCHFDFTLKSGRNPGHLASLDYTLDNDICWGLSCRDTGHHGTNTGHPRKSGMGGNLKFKQHQLISLYSVMHVHLNPNFHINHFFTLKN